jgi:hypothetical protein
LLARARETPPDIARAEYAFETRLLARLRSARPAGAGWGAISWRMLPFFAVIAFLLFLWQAQTAAEASECQQIDYLSHADTAPGAVTVLN